VEEVTEDVVVFWKEEFGALQQCPSDEFPERWSIFHGYKMQDQKEAPSWVTKGTVVYERTSGVRCVVLGVRSKAWVMLETSRRTPEIRWLSVRTASAFTRDFGLIPSRFDRPEPV
jgi:hypothetical protein